MSKKTLSLRGVFTPIVTPFNKDGQIAHDAMIQNLEKWNQTGLRGYIVLGSNGENVHLLDREKIEIFKTARQGIPAEKLMIAGTGTGSTVNTLALTEQAAEIGMCDRNRLTRVFTSG